MVPGPYLTRTGITNKQCYTFSQRHATPPNDTCKNKGERQSGSQPRTANDCDASIPNHLTHPVPPLLPRPLADSPNLKIGVIVDTSAEVPGCGGIAASSQQVAMISQ